MYQIIVNPASRSGKGFNIWKEQIEPALQRGDVKYKAHFSYKAGDVTKLAHEICSSATEAPVELIVLGGDGTVNEAISGIPDTSKVILGYIPTGSSNDLARDLLIPSDPTSALDIILHSGKKVAMDLGTLTYEDGSTRRFAVSCGIGYDAAICEEALHSGIKKVLNKLGLGKLTYLNIALKQLIAARSISATITLDDETTVSLDNMLFTAVMQHRFEGGGFMFCPNADAHDGIMDLCVVGDLSKGRILTALPTAFKGEHYRFKGIDAYSARKVTIQTSEPLWVHTDGEVLRKSSKIELTCQKDAITIIKP